MVRSKIGTIVEFTAGMDRTTILRTSCTQQSVLKPVKLNSVADSSLLRALAKVQNVIKRECYRTTVRF